MVGAALARLIRPNPRCPRVGSCWSCWCSVRDRSAWLSHDLSHTAYIGPVTGWHATGSLTPPSQTGLALTTPVIGVPGVPCLPSGPGYCRKPAGPVPGPPRFASPGSRPQGPGPSRPARPGSGGPPGKPPGIPGLPGMPRPARARPRPARARPRPARASREEDTDGWRATPFTGEAGETSSWRTPPTLVHRWRPTPATWRAPPTTRSPTPA